MQCFSTTSSLPIPIPITAARRKERVSILPPPRGRVSILCPPGHDGRGRDVRVAADALLICSAKKRALGCVNGAGKARQKWNFVIKMPA